MTTVAPSSSFSFGTSRVEAQIDLSLDDLIKQRAKQTKMLKKDQNGIKVKKLSTVKKNKAKNATVTVQVTKKKAKKVAAEAPVATKAEDSKVGKKKRNRNKKVVVASVQKTPQTKNQPKKKANNNQSPIKANASNQRNNNQVKKNQVKTNNQQGKTKKQNIKKIETQRNGIQLQRAMNISPTNTKIKAQGEKNTRSVLFKVTMNAYQNPAKKAKKNNAHPVKRLLGDHLASLSLNDKVGGKKKAKFASKKRPIRKA